MDNILQLKQEKTHKAFLFRDDEMKYYFDIKYAGIYGLEESIMIQNLSYWISKNKKEGRHFHENRYWTYNSCKQFSIEVFPFWSARKIHRILESLIRKGVILRGNFNRHRYDRIGWYAFVDEVEFLTEELNGDASPPTKGKKRNIDKPNTKIDQSNIQKQEIDSSNIVNPITSNVGTIPDITTNVNTNITEEAATAGDVIKSIETSWSRKILPLEEEQVMEMVKAFGLERVQYAVNESILYNKTSVAYLRGILKPKQNGKKTISYSKKIVTQNVMQGENKKSGGMVTFDCTENNCVNTIVHQREQIMKAIELSKPIPCDKCKKLYSAQFILDNAKS